MSHIGYDNGMKSNIPNKNILKAFGVSGKPIRLAGGQGTCYRVDNLVLKPTNNIIESSWIADVCNNLRSDKFRVPKPIMAKNSSWVFNNWTANKFVVGKHEAGNYVEAIKISKTFHQSLVDIPKPEFFDKRNNLWAIADRIAWGELPLPDFELTNQALRKIFKLLTKNKLPNQLIHGDWGTGNILFSKKLGPAVIDFSPYWRPADFAVAIMIIDALVYEGAKESIINLCKNIPDFNQLLLRALVRRICEYIGFQKHKENVKDFSEDIIKHLKLIDIILRKSKSLN